MNRSILLRDPPAAPSPSGTSGGSGVLLRLSAACPRCGSRPALRATAELARAVRGLPAAERMGTYQCQRRGCGEVYPLLARHFRDAG